MTKLLVSYALAAMTFAAAPQALKATDTDALCPMQNATLRGTYMVTSTGTIVGESGSVFQQELWLTAEHGNCPRVPAKLRIHDGIRDASAVR
jgi:hypothetical protein